MIILIVAFFVGAYFYYQNEIKKPSSLSSDIVQVEIEKGESIKSISLKLQKAGVIRSSDLFYLYVKINKIGGKIQAGKFKIPKNLSIIKVAEIIQKATGNDIWITITEGLRYDEIAVNLEKSFLQQNGTNFSKEEFLKICKNPKEKGLKSKTLEIIPDGKSLEGFLFPDTYSIPRDITTVDLIDLLLNTFNRKLAERKIDISKHSKLTSYEVVILASIVEREARTKDEKYMVADILQRRLNGELAGVKLLQADATLLYEQRNWNAVITKELKDQDSPYNTYKRTGLVPSPICNSGVESIAAVMEPKKNEYFYYLHDDKGLIHYAKTYDEHINNVRCYINKNQTYCIN